MAKPAAPPPAETQIEIDTPPPRASAGRQMVLALANFWILFFLLALIIYFSITTPAHAFLQTANFKNIALDTSEVILLGIGETFIIITAGIFALNTNSGIGVTNAARNSGKPGKIKLVEFDAEPVEVQALRQGTVDALIAQDPYSIGQIGVVSAFNYVTGHRNAIKKHYGTASAIITRATVNKPAFKRFLYTRNG